MASTDSDDSLPAATIEALTPADLDAAVLLSTSALWNQGRADWAMLLELGEGWGIRSRTPSGEVKLAASIVVLPYPSEGSGFSWVSMVLVLPEFRRRGFAAQLLRHAVGVLQARGLTPLLDATPAGHAVYEQEGFCDTWGFARYLRPAAAGPASRPVSSAPAGASCTTRPLHEDDWSAIAALDRPAFGADRMPLLRSLAQRLPSAALIACEGARPTGFVLGRDGREAHQIGPLIAADDATAKALLRHALASIEGPVYVDLLDRRKTLLPWLAAQGFAFQRPFMRMVHGAVAAPGDASRIVLVAGPELG